MYEPNQLVEQAILFATEAHRGQLRKGSNLPYILHPLEAAAIVAGLTDDPEVIAAAVLHDVLEDTSATPGELEAAFGPRVTALVQSESENKRPHLDPRDSWQLRKQEALEELAAASPAAQTVALGDKLSNIRAIRRDYCALGEALWQRFNQSDKAKQGWYYRSLGKALSGLCHTDAWQEYTRLTEEVFGRP